MYDIDNIKARTDIHHVISKYVEMEHRYSGYAHYRNPITGTSDSFTVYDSGWFRNEVTGDSGDVIDLVCHIENIPFKEALARLASDAGVEPSKEYVRRKNKVRETSPHKAAQATEVLSEDILAPFIAKQSDAIPYLHDMRSIEVSPIFQQNGVGVEYRPHRYSFADGRTWSFRQRRIILPNKFHGKMWGWQSRRDEAWIERQWREMSDEDKAMAREIALDYVEQQNRKRRERMKQGYVVGPEKTPCDITTDKKKDLIFGLRFMRKGHTGIFGLEQFGNLDKDGNALMYKMPYVIINEAGIDAMSWQSLGYLSIGVKQTNALNLGRLLSNVAVRYIVMEPDEGGNGFVNWVMDRLDGAEWRNKVIRMDGTGYKDPNAMHIAGELGSFAEDLGLERIS